MGSKPDALNTEYRHRFVLLTLVAGNPDRTKHRAGMVGDQNAAWRGSDAPGRDSGKN